MAGVNCPRFGSRPLLQRSNSALGTPSTTSSTIVVGSPRETEAAPAWPFPNHGLLLRSPVPARQAFAHQPLVSSTRRRPVGISHPKLTEVLHRDFADCSALAKALSDQQKVESRVDNLLAAPANPALPATRRPRSSAAPDASLRLRTGSRIPQLTLPGSLPHPYRKQA